MLHYIIQIILFQALFFIVYEVFLKKETFFTGNRVYLIVSQIFAVILPFVKIPSIQNQIPAEYQKIYTKQFLEVNEITSATAITATSNFNFQWQWILYIGFIIASALFIFKITQLIVLYKKGEIIYQKAYKLVSLSDEITPFSFWNSIFLGQHLDTQKQEQIIAHELIHIKQKHSLDLLLFEVFRILFWFNPFVYVYQKRIAEVHEYIVDNALSETKVEKKHYFQSLLSEVFQTENISFTNSYYSVSLLKKRVKMLTKMKSKNRKILKYFIVVPIMALSMTYVACKQNSEPIALLINTNEWRSVSYETGDHVECLGYTQQLQKANNWLEIKNEDPDKDAVVKLIYGKKEAIYRDMYVKSGEIAKIDDIPLGDYYLKITLGNDWKEINVNGKCFGKFTTDAEYQIRQDLIEYKILESPWGKSSSSMIFSVKSRNN